LLKKSTLWTGSNEEKLGKNIGEQGTRRYTENELLKVALFSGKACTHVPRFLPYYPSSLGCSCREILPQLVLLYDPPLVYLLAHDLSLSIKEGTLFPFFYLSHLAISQRW
jgi:hypothetical protein